ncbi:DMT family transporter [Mobilicoccus sp.]|uniref:DMT family transporter n=1 Tax=Mobilicoccus sp. TaxID=2034349 RepID=UPI00289AA054|nr:DMT family transporter [Mobilicoccus sp.]
MPTDSSPVPPDPASADPAPPARSGLTPERASGVVIVAGIATFIAGALGAVQSRANGTLATVFGSAIDAALWSFGSGWLLLTLAMLHPKVRGGLVEAHRAYRGDSLRWWMFLGGLGGGFFVVAQTWSVPQIGVALFTIAIVGGQTLNALLVDSVGLGPAGKAPVTWTRVLGALGTIAGVALASLGRGGGDHALVLAPVFLAVVAGAGMAVQQAINGRVNRHSGNIVSTTWVNFTWGLVLIGGVLLAQVLRGTWTPPRTWDSPAWTFLGGVIGIVFVGVGALVVHYLGVLLATLLTLSGQLIGAVLVDVLGGASHLSPLVLVGVAVTLTSAAFAAVAGRRATVRRARAAAAAPPAAA